MKLAIFGTGSFGSAMALHAARKGHEVHLWGRDPAKCARLQETRVNVDQLPGARFLDGVHISADAEAALSNAQLALLAVPTRHLRAVLDALPLDALRRVPVVNLSKGLELVSGQPGSAIIGDRLRASAPMILSGPSHAEEIARGLPTTVVVAGLEAERLLAVQQALSDDHLRLYTSRDPRGVEYGGILKNVIAIAAGICDGLGLGDNTKAALITRGLAEMARYFAARGLALETLYGLSGVGDLVTTCCSKHGRNRALGEAVARGESLESFEARTRMIAEGAHSTQVLVAQMGASGLDMPITLATAQVLFEGKAPRQAVRDLMQRDFKDESR